MKRRRYIPIAVRCEVAERQAVARVPTVSFHTVPEKPLMQRLRMLLFLLGDEKFELHHRPSLINRPLNRRKTDTVPPANHPAHLVYLPKDDHGIETRVRGLGAQRSDLGQRRYLKNVASNRSGKKKKHKWQSSPLRSSSRWVPKGSRSFRSKRDG